MKIKRLRKTFKKCFGINEIAKKYLKKKKKRETERREEKKKESPKWIIAVSKDKYQNKGTE